MGTGHMHVNLVAHIAMMIINVLLTLALGNILGAIGVIIAWTVTLCLTGVLINILYARRNGTGIGLKEFLPKASQGLTLACFVSALVSFLIYFTQTGNTVVPHPPSSGTAQLQSMLIGMAAAAISVGLISIPFWKHPAREQLTGWLIRFGSNRPT